MDFISRHPVIYDACMETIYFSIIHIHKLTVNFSHSQSEQLSLTVAYLVLLLHLQFHRVGEEKSEESFTI